MARLVLTPNDRIFRTSHCIFALPDIFFLRFISKKFAHATNLFAFYLNFFCICNQNGSLSIAQFEAFFFIEQK